MGRGKDAGERQTYQVPYWRITHSSARVLFSDLTILFHMHNTFQTAFDSFLAKLSVGQQQNIKISAPRGESLTVDAYKAGYEAGYEAAAVIYVKTMPSTPNEASQ